MATALLRAGKDLDEGIRSRYDFEDDFAAFEPACAHGFFIVYWNDQLLCTDLLDWSGTAPAVPLIDLVVARAHVIAE